MFLCALAQLAIATHTTPIFCFFPPCHVPFVVFGDSFDVTFFIYLLSATAAHSPLWLTQRFRRILGSPVLGTACIEQPGAHSLKIRRMDIFINRLDCACEA